METGQERLQALSDRCGVSVGPMPLSALVAKAAPGLRVKRSAAGAGDFEVDGTGDLGALATIGSVRRVHGRGFIQLADTAIVEGFASVPPGSLLRSEPPDGRPSHVSLMFSNPNANKALHLGHLRQNALGTALVRLLKTAGLKVTSVSMNGDWGFHIAQALVGLGYLDEPARSQLASGKSDHLAGACIAAYYRELAARPEVVAEARTLLLRLHARDHSAVAANQQLTNWAMSGHQETYAVIGSRFDREVFESRELPRAEQFVAEGLAAGVFVVRPDGSVGIDLSGQGLWDVTLQRKDGTTTAFLQHASGWDRVDADLRPDLMLFLIGPDWDAPGRAAEMMYERLGIPWATRFGTFHHGLVCSDKGRLRSRYGEALIVDAVLERVRQKLAPPAQHAAAALLKYTFLRVPRTKNAIFDERRVMGDVLPRFEVILKASELVRDNEGLAIGGKALEGPVRALAFAIDGASRAAFRSLATLDPVVLVRHVDRTAAAIVACEGVRIPQPIWQHVCVAFNEMLSILNLVQPTDDSFPQTGDVQELSAT